MNLTWIIITSLVATLHSLVTLYFIISAHNLRKVIRQLEDRLSAADAEILRNKLDKIQ